MKLYGALSELAELIIRLASGKTTKIESNEQSATSGEATVTIPDVGTGGSDEFVMKATTQTLTSKTLTEPVLDSATINNSVKLQTPSDGTPAGTNYSHVGALGFNTTDNKLVVGDGSNIRKFVDDGGVEANDPTSTYIQDIHKKRLLSSTIEDTNMIGGSIGSQNKTTAIEYVNKIGLSKVNSANGLPAQHVLVVDAEQKLTSEAALAKVRGGAGADMTNVVFPATGTLVTEDGTQTLSNKTLENATVSGYEDFAHTTTPAADPTGAVRVYAKSDNKLYTLSPAGIEQAVGSGGSVLLIAKAGHGFTAADVGCPVYLDLNGDYVKAKADAANTAEVAGLINKFVDENNFEVCLGGEVESVGANAIASLVPGELYFLSATDAGKLTATEPAVVGQVSKPVGIARTASKLDFFNMRGVVVGAANLRTQIGLDGDALLVRTTNIQKITSYSAGELAGWVELNATADYKFYVQAQFVKNAAGVWNLSYQTTGDTPPAGFSMDVNDSTEDYIEVTLPAMAGFQDGKINFALNAPAVGTSLPLQVDSTSVNFSEIKASSSAGLTFKEDGGNTTMVIKDDGKVGIGTASPAQLLDVNGVSDLNSILVGVNGDAINRAGNLFIQTTTASDLILRTNSTERMRLDASGNVKIKNNYLEVGENTTASYIGIFVNGIVQTYRATNAADVGVLVANSDYYGTNSNIFVVRSNGAIYARFTSITSLSDVRFKEDVKPLTGCLSKIMQLKPSSWKWKDDRKQETTGFIAQEIEQVFPQFVTELEESEQGIEKPKTVGAAGNEMIANLVAAIQEQQAQIEEMKAEIAALKAK